MFSLSLSLYLSHTHSISHSLPVFFNLSRSLPLYVRACMCVRVCVCEWLSGRTAPASHYSFRFGERRSDSAPTVLSCF